MGDREYCSSENLHKPVRVVPGYILGHEIFKVQCTLHNVLWGNVTVTILCIL